MGDAPPYGDILLISGYLLSITSAFQYSIFLETSVFFNMITMRVPRIWLGHIHKCRPHSSKLGLNQCRPPACGHRSTVSPNFSEYRSAFMDAPSPDSWHSLNTIRFVNLVTNGWQGIGKYLFCYLLIRISKRYTF